MPKNIIIIVAVILLIFAIVGGLFFFIYDKIQTAKKNRPENKPSITTMSALSAKNEELHPEEELSENKDSDKQNAKKTEEKSAEEQIEKITPSNDTKNTATIVILNGGAASGSAGKIERLLENDAYKNVTATNALNENHIGQMIYFKLKMKADAETIQKLLKETYPEIETKEGVTVEQTKGDIVIMLGK